MSVYTGCSWGNKDDIYILFKLLGLLNITRPGNFLIRPELEGIFLVEIASMQQPICISSIINAT